MSVAGTKNFDQPPHDSNRTHLVFSTSGLLLGSRVPLVFIVLFILYLFMCAFSTWCSATGKVSNALYDVRIAERCVDSRADSPWVEPASVSECVSDGKGSKQDRFAE